MWANGLQTLMQKRDMERNQDLLFGVLAPLESGIRDLAISEDGRCLAAIGKGRKAGDMLVVWEVPNWKEFDKAAPCSAAAGPCRYAVLNLALAGAPKQPANRHDGQEVALTSDDYNALLAESIELLKENRHKRGHLGREFRSEGMYLETGESLAPFARFRFQPGDIFSIINGTRLADYNVAIQGFNRARQAEKPESLKVAVWRNGLPVELHFRIRPEPLDS
jgi:hypothetical protein